MSPIPGELTSLADLDHALAEPIGPVLIFKHSPTCGTSALAYEDILDAMATGELTAPIYMVQVRRHRAVSDAIATRFRTRHESPQVLLVRQGRLIWSASHHGVRADAIIKQAQS